MTRHTIRSGCFGFALLLLAPLAAAQPEHLAVAQPEHRSFESPEAAVEAFIAALDNRDSAALSALLGPNSESLVSSGDAVQDAIDREHFLMAYRTRHSLVTEAEGERTLVIGDHDWPLPVPVVQRNGRWLLDGEAGVDELIYRRIGENELGAIAASRGFVEAQREYAAEGRDGDPAGIYALKLLSDEGRHNGLHWPTADGEPPSPVGSFVAAAAAEGYRPTSAAYHGYRYRMLYAQGPHAEGGPQEYFEDGLLTEGFALLAWPAEYGVSGLMTFMVNQDGIVWQQDLGADTDAAARAISAFDPDSSWRAVD